MAYQLTPFDTPAAMKDVNGYPVAGQSGKSQTDIGFVLTTGTYTLTYKGTGTLAVSGIGTLMGGFTTVNGEHRGKVSITGTPGAFGNFLNLQITNGQGQTVTGVRLLFPGPQPRRRVDLPARVPRPVDALPRAPLHGMAGHQQLHPRRLGRSTGASAHFGTSPHGEPYEHVVALVNQTGKDAWVNVPEHATDDFVHQFAKFVAKGLDFDGDRRRARKKQGISAPFRVIVEFSNETWNQGFSAYATPARDRDPANAAKYTGTYDGTYGPSWMSGDADLMKVGQVEGDRLAQIGQIFRTELGSHADAVAPVLSGWALGAVYSDVALRFIKDNYGDPKKYVHYVGNGTLLRYPNGFGDSASLDMLFPSMTANIDTMDSTFQDFQKLVTEYGLEIAAYEGGQSLTGQTNQPIKHLAQHDVRMKTAYDHYLALWTKDFGDATFMHFDLAGDPGLPENIYQYGFWGSIIGVMEDPTKCGLNLPMLTGSEVIPDVVHHCPKYESLQEKVPK